MKLVGRLPAFIALAIWSSTVSLWATEPPLPAHRVKVSKDGDIYLNRQQVTLTELTTRLLELKDEGEGIIYYREAPLSEPSKDAMAIFEVIAATKVPIMMGDQAPPEWGALRAFEIELAPFRLRFAISQGQPVLFGYTPEGSDKPETFYGRVEDQERWLGKVAFLVSANRVIETTAYAPDIAFEQEALRMPSLHVRVIFAQNKGWQAAFPLDEVPSNITSLLEDCRTLGLEMIPNAVSPAGSPAARDR